MSIKKMKVADLLDEPGLNPNRMDPEEYAGLVALIKAKGFLQPILVRPTPEGHVIIDGHHRRRALLEAAVPEADCVVLNVGANEAAVIRLGMNKLRGRIDLSVAADVIDELVKDGLPVEELLLTGFSAEELDDLLASARDDGGVPDILDALVAGNDDDGDPRPFALELTFRTSDELRRARRVLRKAAGKGGELADGLMKILGEDDAEETNIAS